MKQIYNYLSLCLSFAVMLSSCYEAEPVQEVELPQFMNLTLIGSHTVPNLKKMNIDNLSDTTFTLSMQYGGTTNYSRGAIVAEIGVDAELVTAYNTANFTNYQLVGDEAYSFDKTTLTIPDGSNKSDLVTLTIRPRHLDFAKALILPVTIKSVNGAVPANDEYKTVYFTFEADIETEAGMTRWKKLDASSEWMAAFSVNNVFDNDPSTYWHSALTGMPQWFAVDMGAYKRVDGFTYINRKDVSEKSLPKHVTIETSMDGETWIKVLDIAELSQSRVRQVLQLSEQVIARYFRFNVLSTWTGETWSYVAEISIYSGAAPAEEIDLQIHTWTIDSYSSQWNAAMGCSTLLDGVVGTFWHSDPVLPTFSGTLPQWVIIDMKERRQLSGIKMIHRQDDLSSGPTHVVFEVSDDKETWTTLLEATNVPNVTTEIDLPAPVAKRGQYLRMTVLAVAGGGGWCALAELTPY